MSLISQHLALVVESSVLSFVFINYFHYYFVILFQDLFFTPVPHDTIVLDRIFLVLPIASVFCFQFWLFQNIYLLIRIFRQSVIIFRHLPSSKVGNFFEIILSGIKSLCACTFYKFYNDVIVLCLSNKIDSSIIKKNFIC